MNNTFSGLFELRNQDQNTANQGSTSTSFTIPNPNNDIIREGETYHGYGLRMCGAVAGSQPVLTPYLRKIYNNEKQQQQQDQALQDQLRTQKRNEITKLESEIARQETEKTRLLQKQDDTKSNKADIEKELSAAKEKDGEIVKTEKIKLTVGLIILTLLTIYLFIFYSSTFYSAFLLQPGYDDDLSLGMAMLNAKAIPQAWQMGFGAFIFIITAPIIFLGLGYSLHYFMVQKGRIKWFKITALLIVTLSFDFILAYKIGQLLYNFMAINQLSDLEPFSIDLAFSDINFWAVIFCGFIVYIIWGIVFDMIMTAYDGLRSNKHEIDRLRKRIGQLNDDISEIKQKIVNVDGEIAVLNNKKENLESTLNNSILVDLTKIRTALSDFFAGWMTMMSAIGCSQDKQTEAIQTYNNTIAQLFN